MRRCHFLTRPFHTLPVTGPTNVPLCMQDAPDCLQAASTVLPVAALMQFWIAAEQVVGAARHGVAVNNARTSMAIRMVLRSST